MSTSNPPAQSKGIRALAWMYGRWKGDLGPQTVEETWSPSAPGSMDTKIRLSGPDGIHMIELIVIREIQEEDTLMLHLRQFGPALDLRNSQDMTLDQLGEASVSFAGVPDAGIKRLAYTLVAPGHLKVEVTIPSGDVLAAELHTI